MRYVIIRLAGQAYKLRKFTGERGLVLALKFADSYRKRHPKAKVEVR
ncbi:MAG: hypothetical protein JW388_0972 [Nitrospira sp.]|nr:hypothetical protein [Nitrospira sp.]